MRAHDGAPGHAGERGIALITTLLVMMLASVLMVTFVAAIMADQRASGLDRDQTQAYAVAHAGLEQLTSDLNALFVQDVSPSGAQVAAIASTPPSVPGFQFLAPDNTSGYVAAPVFADAMGNPLPESLTGSPITAGPFQGFMGIITPYRITVTARSAGGAEVRMRRELQTVAVPVFQFGMFSENDLAFHAGDDFTFGGRVHTNGNLFLAQGNNSILTLSDRVSAFREIVRTHLPNGLDGGATYNGTVRMIRAVNTYRNLARNEGSLVGTLNSALNEPKWTSLSIGTYNSYIRNGRTGVQRMELPLVADGDGDGNPDAEPIALIRRPNVAVPDSPLVFEQRFFRLAGLRILLSDNAADITNLPGVTADAPFFLGPTEARYVPGGTRPPFAVSAGPLLNGAVPANTYKSALGQPLLNGFLKIELQRQDGTYLDVTQEILNLGFAGRNLSSGALNTAGNACPNEPQPNAVIRLQRVRDIPVGSPTCGTAGVGPNFNMTQNGTDYWPNTLYDTREGQMRDGLGGANLALGGIIHYIELDMNNLRRWILGQIGVNGPLVRNDNGYIVYFSDRRNNRNAAGNETGEFGYEDVVNPPNMNAVNGVLDTGEDVNGNGALEVYGGTPPLAAYPVGATAPLDVLSNPRPFTNLPPAGPLHAAPALVARANRTLFFRRALKIVNGGINGGVNNIIAPGLTIASENPVYVQGNFNATAASVTAEPNVATSIIADAVTMLSNNWNDIRSFVAPSDSTQRPATTTGFRVALVTGKTIPFPKPGWAAASFGSDGGAHNFPRLLENWNLAGVVHRYRGSFVSFFISRQAVGSFKCCDGDSYVRGVRDWAFDVDFLQPNLMPPGTPMFRDVNTLTFRQLLRPTQ